VSPNGLLSPLEKDISELTFHSTTGGLGGTVTTVSTLAEFTAAANNAKNDDTTPRISMYFMGPLP
jgi:hypothetical protein